MSDFPDSDFPYSRLCCVSPVVWGEKGEELLKAGG
ncbi:MAG: hypothetical protein K0S79_1264 [Nitrospira sp.]|nr:hypothetical protein [Nitrospira sp.]